METKKQKKTKYEVTEFFTEARRIMGDERVDTAIARAEKTMMQMKLAELRGKVGKKQDELEHFSQASVSKIESRSDLKLSTLIEYAKDLGVELSITAKYREGDKVKKFTLLETGN